MPTYEVEISAHATVVIEAKDEETAIHNVYIEMFSGLDKEVENVRLLQSQEEIDRSMRHADEVL